jgi:hypothetical protein
LKILYLKVKSRADRGSRVFEAGDYNARAFSNKGEQKSKIVNRDPINTLKQCNYLGD